LLPTTIEFHAIHFHFLVVHQHLLYSKSTIHPALPTTIEYHHLVLYQHLLDIESNVHFVIPTIIEHHVQLVLYLHLLYIEAMFQF